MDRQKALFKFCIFCLNLESTHEMLFFGFSRTNFRNVYFRSRDNVTINIKAGFLQNPNVRDNTFALLLYIWNWFRKKDCTLLFKLFIKQLTKYSRVCIIIGGPLRRGGGGGWEGGDGEGVGGGGHASGDALGAADRLEVSHLCINLQGFQSFAIFL